MLLYAIKSLINVYSRFHETLTTNFPNFVKAWFHGRFFSAKCELFRLFLLNCELSSRNNLFEWSQFKRNRRNISHFAEKKRWWNQAFTKFTSLLRSSKVHEIHKPVCKLRIWLASFTSRTNQGLCLQIPGLWIPIWASELRNELANFATKFVTFVVKVSWNRL
jgi:hypothetical protein